MSETADGRRMNGRGSDWRGDQGHQGGRRGFYSERQRSSPTLTVTCRLSSRHAMLANKPLPLAGTDLQDEVGDLWLDPPSHHAQSSLKHCRRIRTANSTTTVTLMIRTARANGVCSVWWEKSDQSRREEWFRPATVLGCYRAAAFMLESGEGDVLLD